MVSEFREKHLDSSDSRLMPIFEYPPTVHFADDYEGHTNELTCSCEGCKNEKMSKKRSHNEALAIFEAVLNHKK